MDIEMKIKMMPKDQQDTILAMCQQYDLNLVKAKRLASPSKRYTMLGHLMGAAYLGHDHEIIRDCSHCHCNSQILDHTRSGGVRWMSYGPQGWCEPMVRTEPLAPITLHQVK